MLVGVSPSCMPARLRPRLVRRRAASPLRRPTSLATVQAHRGPMTSLVLHDFAPLLATGTRRQAVRVFTNSGQPVTDIRYHDGFLGQRIGPVSSLAFHPHRLLLAVGATDSIVSVHAGVPVRSDR